MRAINRHGKTLPNFVPDYLASSLHDVDFELLEKRGIKYIAFDADSTLVPFRGRILDKPIEQLLSNKRRSFDGWCIASNRITNDLFPLGESMNAQVIRATLFTRKPSKRFFYRVIKHFGANPKEIAMIGDKLIADMYGANRMGLTTVWVETIGRDNPIDRLLRVRYWEKRLMRKYLK